MRKLCLESLEQRTLLAVTGFVNSAVLADPAPTAADVGRSKVFFPSLRNLTCARHR